jgi:DeoR family transcriptional regulator of aga operon
VIAVADSTKLGVVAFDQVCDIQRVDVLVTDAAAGPRLVQQLVGLGVDVRLV